MGVKPNYVMLKQIAISSKENFNGEKCVGYELVDISKYEAVEGERALSHTFLLDSFRKIMGRTLTVIDGAIVDERQNKALKDQIRNIFSDEIEFSSNWAFGQGIIGKLVESIPDKQIGAPVSIEEMLGVDDRNSSTKLC